MAELQDFLPPALKEIHSRSRLYRYFEEKKVVIIEAGPGMGKTAAVADFIANEGKKCIWFRILKDEKGYREFLQRLETAVNLFLNNRQQQNRNLQETGSYSRAAEDFCSRISGRLPDDLYLVIDDFEFVNGATEICSVIEKLLDLLSTKIHIVLLTRETPNLSLARLRSRKELTELKTRDIQFSPDDLSALAQNLYDLNLSTIVTERILENTGGWITGIVYLLEKVSGLGRTEGEFFIDNFLIEKSMPEIDDYFSSDLMTILDKDLSDTVIRISIVSEFTPHLIESVTGKSGFRTISDLQKLNLFITSTDPSAYHFSFNPLFRSYLVSMFRKLDEKVRKETMRVIAGYYMEENKAEEAVRYLCEAGDFDQAKSSMRVLAEELIKNNEYEEINRMLSFFPEDQTEEDPYLSYYKAVVNNLIQPVSSRRKLLKLLNYFKSTGDISHEASIYAVLLTNYFFYQTNADRVENVINLAEEFLTNSADTLSLEQRELLTALIPLGQWWTGSSREEAFEIALRAEETSSRLKNEEAFLCSRLVLAKIYMARGEFSDSKELLLKTEKLFSEGALHLYRHYQCLSSYYLGDNYFYCGEIASAITQTRKALLKSGKDFAFRPYLELNLIFYNLYLSNIEKAEELYEKTLDSDPGENMYLRYNLKFLFEMLIAYRNRNKRRTEYYRNRLLEPENSRLLKTDFPFSFIALAEVSLYTSGPDEGCRVISQLLEEINPEEYPYPYATAMALLGYMKHISGDKGSASETFKLMAQTVKEKNYSNLDICSPELLKSIAEESKSPVFKDFPRLKRDRQAEEQSGSRYGLEITTLGRFSVTVHGEEISAELLGGQKRVMDLLKLLVVYRRNGVMKERIYELFWPRYSYKSARDNLNTIIYRLRKLLNDKDEFLATDINSFRFREDSVITDADRFIEFIERGNAAEKNGNLENALNMYNAAAALYKGDFLESDLYYDFIRDERENLKSRFRNLLFKMVILSLNSADFRSALEWSKKLVEADPLCEPGYRMLMVTSAATGNRSEIPRIFDKLNKKLQAYYKVSADERTVTLRDRLLGGSPPDESMWHDETII